MRNGVYEESHWNYGDYKYNIMYVDDIRQGLGLESFRNIFNEIDYVYYYDQNRLEGESIEFNLK